MSTDTEECARCANRDPRDRRDHGHVPADLAAPAVLTTVTDYSDTQLLEALDDACQHIAGKAWTVTALAQECIRRANERNDAA